MIFHTSQSFEVDFDDSFTGRPVFLLWRDTGCFVGTEFTDETLVMFGYQE